MSEGVLPTLYCISCDGKELLILPDKNSTEEARSYSLDVLEDHCRYFPELAIIDENRVIISQRVLDIEEKRLVPMERIQGKLLYSDEKTILTRLDGESGDTLVVGTWKDEKLKETTKYYPDLDILHALDTETIVLSTRGDFRGNQRELKVVRYSIRGSDKTVYRTPYTDATVGFGIGSLALHNRGSVTVVNTEGKGILIPFEPVLKVKSIHPFIIEGGGGFWVRYEDNTTEAYYSNRDPIETPDATSDLNFPIADNALVSNGSAILSFSAEGITVHELPVPIQNAVLFYPYYDE